MSDVKDAIKWSPVWTIEKFASRTDYECGKSYETVVVPGNVLLTEGATLLLNLLCGAGGTPYNAASTYLGVGTSTTAATAADTGLLGTNTYKIVSGAPVVSLNTATWTATFVESEANHAWQEFTIANGSSNASTNLNRKVSDQSTKVSTQIWVLSLRVTVT